MKISQICFALAGLAIGSLSQSVIADVSHIGIEAMGFEAGELPKLNVNVVSDHNDASLLTFYIRQKYKNTVVLEKLLVDDHKENTFILHGEEKIIDPNSSLIVSEYRDGKWQQYSPVSLFDGDVNKVSANLQDNQPVAIKTMKSSDTYKQNYQAVAKENQAKPEYDYQPSTSAASNELSSPAVQVQIPLDCMINKTSTDTLWTLASNNAKAWGTNVFGAMVAIYQTNPSAFINQNIKKLKADSQLACPSAETLAQFTSPNQDKKTFDALVINSLPQSNSAQENSVDIALKEDEPQSAKNELVEASNEELTSPEEVETVIEEQLTSTECSIDKQPDDSLWSVAATYHKSWNTNIFGAMLAMYDANPNAFAQQKINFLRADAKLSCPSKDILEQYHDAQADKVKFDDLVAAHTTS